MWIPRSVEARILQAHQTRPAVVITGPRQSGKTSLVQHLFPSYRYVSLDLPSVAELAEREPASFLAQYEPPLVIDEVQYAPQLFRYLKIAIDAQRDRMGQFVLTGSQKFSLMQEVADSLAGRVDIIELETLSLREIQDHDSTLSVEDILCRGGFPELYRMPQLEARGFYAAYVATYLERDVRSLLRVSTLRDFERLLRLCALRSGQLLNKSELARDVGISPSTANEWLSILVASNQIVLLEPWFANKSRSIVKSPKLYFADTGLLCFLLNIASRNDLLQSPYFGSIWETFVFAELRKQQIAATGAWNLYFWRDRVREVDFVLHRGGRFTLYEAKASEVPEAKDSANLRYLKDVLSAGVVDQMGVICRTPHHFPLGDGVEALALDKL